MGLRLITGLSILSLLGACGERRQHLDHRSPGRQSPGVLEAAAANLNFYAPSAKEYWARGEATVTLEPTFATRDAAAQTARALELAAYKEIAVGWFLNAFVQDKEEDDPNIGYGNFDAQLRFGVSPPAKVTHVRDLTYSFPFQFDLGGKSDLLTAVAAKAKMSGPTFLLPVGKVSNSDLAKLKSGEEWFRKEPWQFFDPSKVAPEQLESVPVSLSTEPASSDAYIPLDQLIVDGRMSIAAHFGWDGDKHARHEVQLAQDYFQALVDRGFHAPVASAKVYEASKDGPLTKTIQVNGRDVVVEVAIFVGGDSQSGTAGPDPATDSGAKVLADAMRDSLAHRSVVAYIGHSGTLYGFSLGDWNKTDAGEVTYAELSATAMSSRFQLVVAEGCQTYSMADAFWRNPAKNRRDNLNLVTSLGFTDADAINTVVKLIDALTAQRQAKAVVPLASTLLRSFEPQPGSGFTPLYGMHGIDTNPHANPLADPAFAGRACTSDSDCGGSDGNFCASLGGGKHACSFACLNDEACPSGFSCQAKAPDGQGQCLQ